MAATVIKKINPQGGVNRKKKKKILSVVFPIIEELFLQTSS